MPYILYKTNGTKLATIEDANLDITTDLTFVGRNYSGYGQILDQNFVKLLENFSYSTAPTKPIQGQLWFDSTNKRLNICYDGQSFKSIASIRVQSSTPDYSSIGDLWWDSGNTQLKAFDGSGYQIIGPQQSASAKASWTIVEEVGTNASSGVSYPIIKALIGGKPVITVASLGSALSLLNDGRLGLTPQGTSDLASEFSNGVRKGITLAGCDATGSSANAGYYFWGTASEALKTNATSKVTLTNSADANNHYVPFAAGPTGDQSLSTNASFYYTPSTNTLNVTSTAARYADIAERYEADGIYEPGTVLVIGGEKEVTISTYRSDVTLAGIVSTNPAYKMNSDAGNDETHPYIALKGRVPCKVVGRVRKGDLLITSETPGCACSYMANVDDPTAILGRALEDFEGGAQIGIIEVKV